MKKRWKTSESRSSSYARFRGQFNFRPGIGGYLRLLESSVETVAGDAGFGGQEQYPGTPAKSVLRSMGRATAF
jgi:hypothetical protein